VKATRPAAAAPAGARVSPAAWSVRRNRPGGHTPRCLPGSGLKQPDHRGENALA
jgi:hypothetical protein